MEGRRYNLWNLSPRGQLGSHSKYQRKIPLFFQQGRGKGAILKYVRALCSQQDLPTSVVNQSPVYWGFIRAFLIRAKRNTQFQSALAFHMEGGKYSTPAHSSYPVVHRRRETTEKHLWSSQAGGIGSLKYEDLITGLQNTSLPLTSFHNITEGLFFTVAFI